MSAENFGCRHCKQCALFGDAQFARSQICMHPTLEADHFIGYIPLSDVDARNCSGFTQGDPQTYSLDALAKLDSAANDGTDEIQPYQLRAVLQALQS